MTRFVVAFAVVLTLVATSVAGVLFLHGDPETTHPPHLQRLAKRTPGTPLTPAVSGADVNGTETTVTQLAQWAHSVLEQEQKDVDAYLAALEAQRLANTRPAPRPAAPPRGTVGECSGFAVPDYIVQRESGGNPSAYNPSSGAYGCTQTLLSHYSAGGVCAGLDPYTIDGQRACTQILVDRAGLTPWVTR